jgi:hypothetical protein
LPRIHHWWLHPDKCNPLGFYLFWRTLARRNP